MFVLKNICWNLYQILIIFSFSLKKQFKCFELVPAVTLKNILFLPTHSYIRYQTCCRAYDWVKERKGTMAWSICTEKQQIVHYVTNQDTYRMNRQRTVMTYIYIYRSTSRTSNIYFLKILKSWSKPWGWIYLEKKYVDIYIYICFSSTIIKTKEHLENHKSSWDNLKNSLVNK